MRSSLHREWKKVMRRQKNELAEANLRLVVSIAKEICGTRYAVSWI